MNVRMPGPMSAEVLAVQDAYLRERAEEKEVVRLDDIPVIRDGLSVWQGDITLLSMRLSMRLIRPCSGALCRAIIVLTTAFKLMQGFKCGQNVTGK